MKWFIVLTISMSASPLSSDFHSNYFVVWNVGQGLWTTSIEDDTCRHFDAGGEHFPWAKIILECQWRKNIFHLSHWDWDHLGALSKKNRMQQLRYRCLARIPPGKTSRKRRRVLDGLKLCPDEPPVPENLLIWVPPLSKKSNDNSLVHIYQKFILPGDSSAQQEAQWANFASRQNPKILILGHHGSKTASSMTLLRRLSQVHTAVSSARYDRHRHPHSSVEARVRMFKMSLLKTEEWGNIWFQK